MTAGELAARQLEEALGEQARLGDQYERAVGTAVEQASFMRLQAATLRVSNRDRLLRSAQRNAGAQPGAA